MDIVFFNTKGGVGKSTLCNFSARVLLNDNYRITITNTDRQSHVITRQDFDSTIFLHDTTGALTVQNEELLAQCRYKNAVIVVPISIGTNDIAEIPNVLAILDKFGLRNKTKFSLRAHHNAKDIPRIQQWLISYNLSYFNTIIPHLVDFSRGNLTHRTDTVIRNFLSEIL